MRQDPEKVFDTLLRRHLGDNLEKVSTGCPDENTVSAYLEGALPQKSRADFEKHAALCARCQEELGFLLRSSGPTVADPSPPALSAQDTRSSWLTTLQAGLAWFSNLGMKPALAILAVTLISGYVGIELFQRESVRRQSSAEVAQSMPQDRRGVREETLSHPAQETGKQKAELKTLTPEAANEKLRANQDGLTPAKKMAASKESVVLPDGALSKDENLQKPLRNVYSPAPPESSEADKTSLPGSRSDNLSRSGAAALPGAPPPQPSSSVVKEQKRDEANGLKRSLYAGKPNVVTAQSAPENQPISASDQPSADEEASSKTDLKAKEASLQKTKVHDLTVGRSKQEASARSQVEGAQGPPEDRKPRQLRVAGKTFELQNNVWTDLSISDQSEKAEVVIYKNSSDYPEQIKPLSAYHPYSRATKTV